MSFRDDFLKRQANPRMLSAIVKAQDTKIQQLGQSFVRVKALDEIAESIGSLQFRALDANGKLRVLMSATDVFDELGVHAHLAGVDENGKPQFWGSSDDGALYAGGGAVKTGEDGILFNDAGDAFIFYDPAYSAYGYISIRANLGFSSIRLRAVRISTETNQISNGDFSTGDLTNWTETDPSSKISVVEVDGNPAVKFTNASWSSEYIQQNLAATASLGILVTFRAKVIGGANCGIFPITDAGSDQVIIPLNSEWRNVIAVVNGSASYLRIGVDCASSDVYIDDIVVRPLAVASNTYIDVSPTKIDIIGQMNTTDIAVTGDVKKTGNSVIVTNGNSHDHNGGDGAQIDHGGLAGLNDDDHPQYLLKSGGTIMGPVNFNEHGQGGRGYEINDDTAVSLTPSYPYGLLLVIGCAGGVAGEYAIVTYRVTASPFCYSVAIHANFARTTGVLSGTTGEDGKFTISAHSDGKIYLENRKGSTAYIVVQFLAGLS